MLAWAGEHRRVAKTLGTLLARAGVVEVLRELRSVIGGFKKAFRADEPPPAKIYRPLGMELYETLS